MTIAELRKRAIYTLAERSAEFEADTLATIERATKAMNSFYKFAGFAVNKFYYENDSRHYNAEYAARLEEIEDRRMDKVNKYLAEFAARIQFNGIYPSIAEVEEIKSGCPSTLNITYWYN